MINQTFILYRRVSKSMKYFLMGGALHQRLYTVRQPYTAIQTVGWVILVDVLRKALVFYLFIIATSSEESMNNDISKKIEKANNMLQSFNLNPRRDDANHLLGRVLDEIDDIDINSGNAMDLDYRKCRLSLLILHLAVLREFDKHYIPDYKPNKKYTLNLMPPLDSVDGPVWGGVDPKEIKYDNISRAYEKELADNKKLGEEIAFQSELSALKIKLSVYDEEVGVISDSVNFFTKNYTDSDDDQLEIKKTLNKLSSGSVLEEKINKALIGR